MRAFQAIGLDPSAFQQPLPDLSPLAQLAVECWSFCEGWAPERWPIFDAFHDVPDWTQLAELLQALRRAMAAEADTAAP